MNILFRKVKVVQKASPFNGRTVDIFIENGIIRAIGEDLSHKADQSIDMQGMHVSAGWFDLQTQSGEPGYEFKEDFESLCQTALAGGFTSILLMPDGQPCVDNKASVELIKRRTEKNPLHVFPAGALSKGMKGEELSEMVDLAHAGCMAFTDNAQPIKNSKLLLLAGQYARHIQKPILCTGMDSYLSKGASVNEGVHAVNLGMKGIPLIAENITINRDLYVAQYAQFPIHFLNITSPEAIEWVAKAKLNGVEATVSLAAHYICFSDEVLPLFDSNFKVFPPLRSDAEKNKLIALLKEGKIDILCSNHIPEDRENKIIEFEKAAYGTIGLQSFFGAVYATLQDQLPLEDIIEKFTDNPRRLLHLPCPQIKEGEMAELTFFSTHAEWSFDKEMNKSKSENSAFFQFPLKGKAIGVYSNSTWVPGDL